MADPRDPSSNTVPIEHTKKRLQKRESPLRNVTTTSDHVPRVEREAGSKESHDGRGQPLHNSRPGTTKAATEPPQRRRSESNPRRPTPEQPRRADSVRPSRNEWTSPAPKRAPPHIPNRPLKAGANILRQQPELDFLENLQVGEVVEKIKPGLETANSKGWCVNGLTVSELRGLDAFVKRKEENNWPRRIIEPVAPDQGASYTKRRAMLRRQTIFERTKETAMSNAKTYIESEQSAIEDEPEDEVSEKANSRVDSRGLEWESGSAPSTPSCYSPCTPTYPGEPDQPHTFTPYSDPSTTDLDIQNDSPASATALLPQPLTISTKPALSPKEADALRQSITPYGSEFEKMRDDIKAATPDVQAQMRASQQHTEEPRRSGESARSALGQAGTKSKALKKNRNKRGLHIDTHRKCKETAGPSLSGSESPDRSASKEKPKRMRSRLQKKIPASRSREAGSEGKVSPRRPLDIQHSPRHVPTSPLAAQRAGSDRVASPRAASSRGLSQNTAQSAIPVVSPPLPQTSAQLPTNILEHSPPRVEGATTPCRTTHPAARSAPALLTPTGSQTEITREKLEQTQKGAGRSLVSILGPIREDRSRSNSDESEERGGRRGG